jgi:hypothetical protein
MIDLIVDWLEVFCLVYPAAAYLRSLRSTSVAQEGLKLSLLSALMNEWWKEIWW